MLVVYVWTHVVLAKSCQPGAKDPVKKQKGGAFSPKVVQEGQGGGDEEETVDL